MRQIQANERVEESIHVVVEEVERENGDIERKYGRLSRSSIAGAVGKRLNGQKERASI